MPCTSERRPMKFDGPTLRQRNTLTTEESSICADTGAANAMALATPTAAVTKRFPCITNPAEWGMSRRWDDITVTMPAMRALAHTVMTIEEYRMPTTHAAAVMTGPSQPLR